MRFDILLPTRGRIEGLRRAVRSIFRTASGDVTVWLGVDEDDEETMGLHLETLGPRVEWLTFAEGTGSSRKTHDLAAVCTGDAMRIASNDEEFLTQGWDGILFDRWKDDPYWCLYTNDKDGENTGGRCPIITREWYEVAGYYPPHFWHWHADQWVTEIATAVDRLEYIPEVSILHRHPKKRLGGAKHDAVYKRRGEAEWDLWGETLPEREAAISRLRQALCVRS